MHFFLSVLLARPHALGWDLTMRPLDDGRNFDITVHLKDGESRVYRTLGLLSKLGTRKMLGRGTRVWKAVLLKSGKEYGLPVAIKDAWVEAELGLEGAKFADVLHAEQIEASAELRERLNQAFLTVESHGIVFSDDERKAIDNTLLVCDPEGSTEEQVSSSRSSKPLVHYRIIFKEICRSLYNEDSLPAFFGALDRITQSKSFVCSSYCSIDHRKSTGLQILHTAGWVHRDVSMGNIMLDANGNAGLGDFEYD